MKKNKKTNDRLNTEAPVNLALVESGKFAKSKKGKGGSNSHSNKSRLTQQRSKKDAKTNAQKQKTNKKQTKTNTKENSNKKQKSTKSLEAINKERLHQQNNKKSALHNKKAADVHSRSNTKDASKRRKTTDGNGDKKMRQDEIMHYNQPKGKLKVIFLGGVGEVGKNMTAFEYRDSIVVVDCGMAFPSSEMPGVDVVIPDFTYLLENRHKLKGILLTHGHEDHIGGLPYFVNALGGKVDVYGTKMTLALAENKLAEHSILDRVNFVPIADKSIVSLADFSAEFIHVSHSVAGSVAICLRTPVGIVLHTGDFKVDYTPLGNEIMNLNRIAEIGREGVLLLMSESTNVEKPGYTMSESVVQDTLNKVFHDAKGRRIIIATFASNIDRVSMIIELAKLYKRKIAVSGKSMIKYIETAQRIGLFKFEQGLFVDIDKINDVEDGKLLILSTGSQGEPMAALTRMASGEFNKVKIGSNDTIVISANPIPGNEKDVYNVVNKLYRLGAMVVYSALSAVHVSGHACQEELKLVYTLVKPKYFIPVHGEYRHLKQHSMLVEKLNHRPINIIIPDIGDCVELDGSTFKVTGQVQGGNIMVDGLGVGDVGNVVLKDRLSLAEEGILVCVVALDKQSGTILPNIEVVSRGCFFAGDSNAENPTDELKQIIRQEMDAIEPSRPSIAGIKTAIQRCTKKYFKVKLKRNPVVLPVIVEV